MNIYVITQTEIRGYDTYDSAVVVAKSARDARRINPDGKWNDRFSAWCKVPKSVETELVGKALKRMKRGIICSSFNAG